MPARPVVRLLTRRTGIRRAFSDLTNAPLLEIAEVFRVDVVGQLFEGREPVLRVIYRITQTPPQELQQEYPLELDDLPEPVLVRQPQVHPAERWARSLYRAIFCGNQEDWIALHASFRAGADAPLQQALALYGRLESRAWAQRSPAEFFTLWNLSNYNANLQRYSDEINLTEERNLMIETIERLLNTDPEEVLALGPKIDDFVTVMNVLAWTLNKEEPHPLLN